MFCYVGGALRFHINNGSSTDNTINSTAWSPEPGRWYHLAVVKSGNDYSFFIDGSAAGSATATIAVPYPIPADLTIANSEGELLTAALDDVRIYDRALTAAEVAELYAEGGWPSPGGIPRSGLVGEWLMSGDAKDSSGEGEDGSLNGNVATTTDRFGKANKAYEFDGSGDYIQAAADWLPTAERTVSLWFYAYDITNKPGLLGYGGNGDYSGWIQGLNMSGEAGYQKQGHNNIAKINSVYSSEPVNRWVHWVITNSSSGTKEYVDGAEIGENESYSNATAVASKSIFMGSIVDPSGTAAYTDGNTGWLRGKLDDVRIYDRALTADEVSALYQEGGWPAARGNIWDSVADFSTSANPNGAWTYGWIPSSSSTPFTEFNNVRIDDEYPMWNDTGTGNAPLMWKMTGTGSKYAILHGEVDQHPGPSDERATMRWTAPHAGTFDVAASFFAGDSAEESGFVLKNGAEQWHHATTSDNPRYTGTFALSSGDTLDFAVGDNYSYGSTPVSVVITERP
jgi:hypothetical protein